MLKEEFKSRKRGSVTPLLNFLDWQSVVLSELFTIKFRPLYWLYDVNTGKTPSCITSNCEFFHCTKQPIPNCTFNKISVPRQVFSSDGQNHIMSHKTTYDIRAKGSVYRKYSKTLIFHFWRRLLVVHLLLIVHHRQNQSCSYN